jgi:hypothetical protein
MIKVEPVEKILRIVLASGKLKDEKPLSLLLIAPVECGKTSLIRRYCLKADNVFLHNRCHSSRNYPGHKSVA